jgi:hypothetical protein
VPKSLKAKPEDPRLIVIAIAPTGEVKSALIKKKGKKVPVLPAKKAKANSADDADIDSGDDTQAAPAAPARSMTFAGLAMVAAAQTEAIRKRFRQDGAAMNTMDLLRMLCLAVCADNVRVNDSPSNYHGQISLKDMRAKLLTSGGAVDGFATNTKELACELLARLVVISSLPNLGSGGAGLAIGHHIAAHECMEPFDTPEFLATLSSTTLKAAAEAAGVTGAKTAKALRERLEGKIGMRWWPAEADFEELLKRREAQQKIDTEAEEKYRRENPDEDDDGEGDE